MPVGWDVEALAVSLCTNKKPGSKTTCSENADVVSVLTIIPLCERHADHDYPATSVTEFLHESTGAQN